MGELNEAGARLARDLCDEYSTADRPRLVPACWARPTAPPPSRSTSTIPAFRNITFDQLRETYREGTRA